MYAAFSCSTRFYTSLFYRRLGNSDIAVSEHLYDINEKLCLLLGYLEEVEKNDILLGGRCLDTNVNVLLVVELYGRFDYIVYALCDIGIDKVLKVDP